MTAARATGEPARWNTMRETQEGAREYRLVPLSQTEMAAYRVAWDHGLVRRGIRT